MTMQHAAQQGFTPSVVTPKRFASGRTWEEYLAAIGSSENLQRPRASGSSDPRPDNTETFKKNDDAYTMKPEHEATLRALPKRKMLVLAEDWCPDVHRGLPVLARICSAAGWELRIFQRDENNNDIHKEFLYQREYESIPTAVLYTPKHEYVGHWIERPAIANKQMDAIRENFQRRPDESEEDMRRRLYGSYRELQTSGAWDAWRDVTVDEIIEIARREPAERSTSSTARLI